MRFITRARPRTRSLSPDELKIYLQVLYRSNIRRQFKLTLHIILLTLVRKSKLLQARWINVNLDDGEWLTPEAQSKTGKPHTVYLSTQVREMFVELWQLAGDSELVLPGRGSLTRPFAANALNQAMGAMSFPIPPFTIHDLRRTGSTILHEQGYSSDVVEKALNHTIGGVRGVYNRAEYADQRRAMLQSWADYISGLNGHFTSERTQLMSDVEVTKVSKVEDSGEIFSAFEHHGIYDRVHRYSYLPDPYPILPNFGVLYLSVPRAASLIAHHLATNISDSPREEKKAELRSALTAQVQARILQEVISGRLPSVTTIADTGNLTVQRDERI
jgi:hypothetical protein